MEDIKNTANATDKLAETAQKRGWSNTILASFLVLMICIISYNMYSRDRDIKLLMQSQERQLNYVIDNVVKSLDSNTQATLVSANATKESTLVMTLAMTDLKSSMKEYHHNTIDTIDKYSEEEKKNKEEVILQVKYAKDEIIKCIRIKRENEEELKNE